MHILGLDLGTNTGWALMSEEGDISSGIQSFKKKRGDSPGMIFLKFYGWLTELLSDLENNEVLVAYEMAHHRGGRATEVGVGLVSQVQKYCALREFEHTSVHSSTLKKMATGNGKASKEEVQLAAENAFGFTVQGDDQSDALWVLAWAAKEVGITLV